MYVASTAYQAASGNSTILAKHFLGVVAIGTGAVDVYVGTSAVLAKKVAGLTAGGNVMPGFPVPTDQSGSLYVICAAGVAAIVYYSN